MVAQQVDPSERGDGDDKAREIRAMLAGFPSQMEWLPAASLEIDGEYQRIVEQTWVNAIASGFDPVKFKPLQVNRRRWDGNRLFVMDGQHRLLAIRHMGWGDQNVPCDVYDNLSRATEAAIFDTQSNTRKLTATARFRSRLAQGEADARMVDAIVRASGFRLNLDNGEVSEGRIVGVASLDRIFRRYKAGMLVEVVDAIRDGFGTEVGPRAAMLEAVAVFLYRYNRDPHFRRDRLVHVFRTKTAGSLIAEGTETRRALGSAPANAIAFRIWQEYNKRIDRKLADWKW